MMKDFSRLNDLIKGVEVNGGLQQIINLMSIARSAVSAASNLSNNYARSYTQVQQIQYDDKGAIKDVTPAENQAIANTIISDCVQQLHDLQIQWDNINGSIQSFPVTPESARPFPVLGDYDELVDSKLQDAYIFVFSQGKWTIKYSSSTADVSSGCIVGAIQDSRNQGMSAKPCIVINTDQGKWALGLLSVVVDGGKGYIILHDPFHDKPRKLHYSGNTTISQIWSGFTRILLDGATIDDIEFNANLPRIADIALDFLVSSSNPNPSLTSQAFMNLQEDVSSYVTSKAQADVVEMAKGILTSPDTIIASIPS